jgi:PAS domain S-box-containing protein
VSSYRLISGIASVFGLLRVGRFIACVTLVLIVNFFAFAAEPPGETPPAPEPKRVLLVYQDEMNLPGERALDNGIRSVIGGKPEIQLYSEHLDTYSFSDPKFQKAQLAWFRNKYRNQGIDLVIALGVLPQSILPGIPTVFGAIESNGLTQRTLPVNSTAVWLSGDVKGTLAAAARLQPNARQLVVLCGTSGFDRHLELVVRKTPLPSGTNWEVSYWNEFSVEEIRSRLAELPKDAIVLYVSIERDGTGRPYVPRDLIPGFSAASSAPMYGLSDTFIGFGIVGGSVISFEAQGRQVAELGQRILQGDKPSDVPPATAASSYVFDWRELRRFGLNESALPAGSIVKFAIRSPWQLYGRWIVGGVAFMLVESTFIFYLLVQRSRRRRAESLLRYELDFESLVSDLSASFATGPTGQTDAEIENALEKFREFLTLDRVCLYEARPSDDKFELRYSAGLKGIPSGPQTFSRHQFPWFVSNLLQGTDSVMRRGEELPSDARKEQAFLVEQNYTFVAIVPMRAAGLTVGSLAFASFHEGTWSDKVIQQFRVVAEVFANVLARQRIEDGLQESQQRFQMMADTAPVMIWMSGTDKLCTFFNKQWLEFTGRSLEKELGNGWSEGVHPNDLEHTLRTYLSGFDARLPFSVEYRLRRANGKYGWVFDTGVPRYTPAGEFAGYIGSCIDITDRIQAEQGVIDLSGRLISAQEDERSRIARELHDDFSQRLALLAIQLGQASQSLPHSEKALSASLHAMWERTTELSADIHKLSHQLHSSKLHHLGLLAAAKSLCEEAGKQYHIQIEFRHREMPEEISPDISLCFFRIVQEALNNIVKHSGAKQAHVEFVGSPSLIHLRIVDAGVGCDPSSTATRGGLGLASMRERLRLLGGTMVLHSSPMEGTEIVAEVPLTQTHAGAFRMNRSNAL